jgi:hypothetical protein
MTRILDGAKFIHGQLLHVSTELPLETIFVNGKKGKQPFQTKDCEGVWNQFAH